MRRRNWNHAAMLSIAFFGLIFLLGSTFMSPAGSAAMEESQTDAKCKVNVAAGKETPCILIKDSDERIVWYNSSPQDRSVRFKRNDNPFSSSNMHCWDVPAQTPEDHGVSPGKIDANAHRKDYTSYTHDGPCSRNPPSDRERGTPKVTIQ
jgi:hypothetical protein